MDEKTDVQRSQSSVGRSQEHKGKYMEAYFREKKRQPLCLCRSHPEGLGGEDVHSHQKEVLGDLYHLQLKVRLFPILGIFLDIAVRSKTFLEDENYFGVTAIALVLWTLNPGHALAPSQFSSLISFFCFSCSQCDPFHHPSWSSSLKTQKMLEIPKFCSGLLPLSGLSVVPEIHWFFKTGPITCFYCLLSVLLWNISSGGPYLLLTSA
jgi:hypothetical protein